MVHTGVGLALLGTVIASGVLGGGVALVAYRRPEAPGRNAFAALAATLSGWCLVRGLGWTSSPGPIALAFDVLASNLALVSVFLWLVFVVRYTGHGEWLTRRRLAAIVAFVAAYALASTTSPLHGLVWTNVRFTTFESLTVSVVDLGPIALLTYAVSYLTILATYFLLGRFALRSRPGYRMQAVTIMLASVALSGANVLYFAGVRLHPGFDPSPLFFLWMVLVVGWALFRHDFLDVTPLATDLLIEEMEDPVLILDDDRRVVDRNDAATGLLPDGTGMSLSEAAPELAAVIDAEEDTITVTTDSGERIYDVRTTRIADQHGISHGCLVVLRDVTLQHRRARELERQNEQLERFASVISHDLRNPLSTAHGYAELARQGDDEAIEDVLAALEEMEALIADVLQLARDGRTVSEPDPVSLAEVADSAWAFVDSDGAELVVEADVEIEADERRVDELFGNLFRNAIEHGDADLISVGPIGEDGAAGFYVADDGRGIPPDDRESVFEPGYTTAGDGTGLGLAIVRTIAEAHGWTVSLVESGDGGARFEFRTDATE